MLSSNWGLGGVAGRYPPPSPSVAGEAPGAAGCLAHPPLFPPHPPDLRLLIRSLIALKKGKGLSQAPSAGPPPWGLGGVSCPPAPPLQTQKRQRWCKGFYWDVVPGGIRQLQPVTENGRLRGGSVGGGPAPRQPHSSPTHVTSRKALFSTYFRRYLLLNLVKDMKKRVKNQPPNLPGICGVVRMNPQPHSLLGPLPRLNQAPLLQALEAVTQDTALGLGGGRAGQRRHGFFWGGGA